MGREDGHKTGRALWLILAIFMLVVFALQWSWGQARGTTFERLVIDQATVTTAVHVINYLTPQVSAVAMGSLIQAPNGGINIINGCEGTEVLFLLMAAILAYPLSWQLRVAGLLGGTVIVFVLNQLRLLALFYSYCNDRPLFDQLHGLVAPLVLIMATLAFFMILIRLDQDTSFNKGI
jgi:exosortase/archaeosortase family protein